MFFIRNTNNNDKQYTHITIETKRLVSKLHVYIDLNHQPHGII